jgi:branched-chain amino acid transport system permease protein
MDSAISYLSPLLMNVGIFIILALGLNLINGICGLFSLGHAGFWAVGAYAGAAYSVYFPLPVPEWLNLQISCLIGASAAGLSGLLIGLPCLRLRGDYLAMATLGFGEIIRILIVNTESIGGPRGFINIPHWSNLFWIYFWVVVIIILLINLLKSTFGRAIISIREDEIAAESMGISTFKYKTVAFVIGAAMAGLAGSLFAHSQQFLHPNGFTFMWSVIILLMIILGGLGSMTGSIVGAVVLTILPELLRFLGETVSEWRMVIYSILLIVLMLWRPKGIFGKHELDWRKLFGQKAKS